MNKLKSKLIYHPIRMRIIQLLSGGNKLTTKEIQEHLLDVPQATLYRHLSLLLESNIITVVETRQIRGTTEKIYSIHNEETLIEDGETNEMDSFIGFVSHLIDDFSNYLNQENIDFERDNVGYRKFELNLTDSEFEELFKSIGALLFNAMNKEESEDRRKRAVVFFSYTKADEKDTSKK